MKKTIFSRRILATGLAFTLACGMCLSGLTDVSAATVKLNKKSITIKVGGSFKLKVKGTVKGKVKWTSNKKKVATVSSKGVVKGKKKGKAVITAKAGSKKMTCKVNVVNKEAAVVSVATPTQNSTVTAAPTMGATPTAAVPTATAAPTAEPTAEPTPTSTPNYMSEGAFVYDKLDISWIDPEKPMIAFTFDDGPVGSSDTSYGMRIQKALNEYGFHATFNYVTSKLTSDDMKNEVLEAVKAGHEVGNHTSQWNSLSDNASFADGDAIVAEIEKSRKTLEDLTGISNFTLRPPNLGQNDLVKDNCNVPMIGCNIISNDWEDATTKEHIVEITKTAKDGDIVLLHETMKNTTEAVEELVPYFAEQGYQIVSVSELFAAKDIPLYAGNYYNKAEYMEPRK